MSDPETVLELEISEAVERYFLAVQASAEQPTVGWEYAFLVQRTARIMDELADRGWPWPKRAHYPTKQACDAARFIARDIGRELAALKMELPPEYVKVMEERERAAEMRSEMAARYALD